MKKTYLIAIILVLFSGFAYSESSGCTYNGKTYSEGSVIGPLICVNGKWVKK